MSDMVYTLKPVKVCLDGDDCNVFDAYLVGYGRRGFCEHNRGGYEHPHFTKPEAMRVMRALNRDADNGMIMYLKPIRSSSIMRVTLRVSSLIFSVCTRWALI